MVRDRYSASSLLRTLVSGVLVAACCGTVPVRLAHASPPPARAHGPHGPRSTLAAAQTAFIAALQQIPVVGADQSGVSDQWSAYKTALTAYLRTSGTWFGTAHAVQQDISRESGPLGYAMQDWLGGGDRVRLVSVSDWGASYGQINTCTYSHNRYPNFTLRVFLSFDAVKGVRAQTVAETTSGSDQTIPGSFLKPYATIEDARSWTTGKTRYLAVIDHDLCPGSGGDFPHLDGARLAPKSGTWLSDPAMFPINAGASANIGYPAITFSDKAGTVIKFSAAFLSTTVSECNACYHAYGERTLTRMDATYQATPWHVIPGPYVTLVQAVAAAEKDQTGPTNECSFATDLQGLVTTPAVATSFCKIMWKGAAAPATTDTTINSFPPYKSIPTTLDIGVGDNKTVAVTVLPVGGQWLIAKVQTR